MTFAYNMCTVATMRDPVRFTIADLLVATSIAGVGVGALVAADRWFNVPAWVHLAAAPVVVLSTVGWLLGQFRGALVGAVIGFAIGLFATIAAAVLHGGSSRGKDPVLPSVFHQARIPRASSHARCCYLTASGSYDSDR